MAKNVLQKYWDGTKWEEIHPVTKATNVITSSGSSVETQLADITKDIKNIDLSADKVTLDSTILNSKNVKAGLEELFTFADNGKKNWVDVIGNPLNTGDSFSTLKNKTQSLKNTMASNLKDKEISASGTESLNNLINKIEQISTSNIKSIQRGSISTKGNETIKINWVDINKSIVRINRINHNDISTAELLGYFAKFIDNTTIEMGTHSSGYFVEFYWEVIEFQQGKVQSGELENIKGTDYKPYIVNINKINLNKTILIVYAMNNSYRKQQSYAFPGYFIKNENSFCVIIDFDTIENGNKIYWQLIDLS